MSLLNVSSESRTSGSIHLSSATLKRLRIYANPCEYSLLMTDTNMAPATFPLYNDD